VIKGLLLLSLVVIAAIVALYWRRIKSAVHPPSGTHPKSNPFHAVTVKFRKNACEAVRQLEAKRFLAKEAPRLPLPNCTAKNCGCRYVHYDDRRGEDRREGIRVTPSNGVQRRSQQDRRRA
jgi:hypothetical protein